MLNTVINFVWISGRRQVKTCFRACVKCSKYQSDLYSLVILCVVANNFASEREGPVQTARKRSLIWAFAVRICLKHVFAWRGDCLVIPCLKSSRSKTALVNYACSDCKMNERVLDILGLRKSYVPCLVSVEHFYTNLHGDSGL